MRYVAFGDSITHGFKASGIASCWPLLLAEAKGWQLINMGYGGRRVHAFDGPLVATLSPDVVTIQVAANDFVYQKPLDDVRREMIELIRSIADAPSVRLVAVITPLWADWELPVPLDAYRRVVADTVREFGRKHVRLIDGPALTLANRGHFLDKIHPNDLGTRSIADRLIDCV